jgi:hypothetical protein
MANKKFSEFTEATTLEDLSLAGLQDGDNVKVPIELVNIRPYKVYTALLTQTDTNPPVATVLENTIGNIVWSRSNTGIYEATLNDAYTLDKTHCLCGTLRVSSNVGLIFIQFNENSVRLIVSVNGFISDNLLNNFSIEIRVYN